MSVFPALGRQRQEDQVGLYDTLSQTKTTIKQEQTISQHFYSYMYPQEKRVHVATETHIPRDDLAALAIVTQIGSTPKVHESKKHKAGRLWPTPLIPAL